MADESRQWYNRYPSLLTVEKIAMQKFFPQFTLDKLDDGRMCWLGSIKVDGREIDYHLLVVYTPNHPFCCKEYSSIMVYPMMPDSDEIINSAKETPGFLKDDCDNMYLELLFDNFDSYDNPQNNDNKTNITAAAALLKAVDWLKMIKY
ncbi:MAG: hypothetical protein NC082_04035 [Clostridiales bacterium]|nr:hypothetical protein [Clostridiales bacterium]